MLLQVLYAATLEDQQNVLFFSSDKHNHKSHSESTTITLCFSDIFFPEYILPHGTHPLLFLSTKNHSYFSRTIINLKCLTIKSAIFTLIDEIYRES